MAARCLIGAIFAVSAVAKLRNRGAFGAFASWVRDLPVPPLLRTRQGMPLAVVMAAAEAAIVVLVAFPWTAMAGLLLATATLACFAAGAFLLHRRRPGEPCSCFGASTVPLGLRHVARNVLLCLTAAAGAAVIARAGAGTGSAPAAGIVLSLWAAVTAAMVTVFLDDIAAFARRPQPRHG
jgi:hypothetical protein